MGAIWPMTQIDFIAENRNEVARVPWACSMNVTQIALMVGFQSSQSFATAFKRSFKSTPRDVKNGTVNPVEPRELLHSKEL